MSHPPSNTMMRSDWIVQYQRHDRPDGRGSGWRDARPRRQPLSLRASVSVRDTWLLAFCIDRSLAFGCTIIGIDITRNTDVASWMRTQKRGKENTPSDHPCYKEGALFAPSPSKRDFASRLNRLGELLASPLWLPIVSWMSRTSGCYIVRVRAWIRG